MKILILNGSPRGNGLTVKMIEAFRKGAETKGHSISQVDVCRKNIHGCLACEYCHTKGNGTCIQKDDMQQVYPLLKEADMLVIASPVYYHNLTGQLKCTIDRFYAIGTKEQLPNLKKVAMFLASGDPDMYDGALFSLKGDFEDYLNLEVSGVYTANGEEVPQKTLDALFAFGRDLM